MKFFQRAYAIVVRLGGESEDVRRRWAVALLVAAVPAVLGLWWATLRFSFAGTSPRGVLDAAALRAAGMFAEISRGFSNVQSSITMLRDEVRMKERMLDDEGRSEETPRPATYPLPLAE